MSPDPIWDEMVLRRAYWHVASRADEVTSSVACGCFYCLAELASDEIRAWVAGEGTALCPRCGIDAVIGDLSGYPVRNAAFLRAMHEEWF